MPIHDQSYRRYGGHREALGRAWTVIAWAGIRSMIAKRTFLGLLIFAWIPFIVRAVQIYIAANFPQASILAPTAETFREFIEQQGVFVFFVTIYVGAGLIANDRRANALQIYLSKPLMRVEYIAGKLATLMAFLLLVTWVPGILLLLLQVAFAGSFTFLRANLFLFPALTLASFLQVIVASFTMLALSSLSNSSRYVGHPLRGRGVLQPGDVRRADGHHRQLGGVVGLLLGQPGAGRGRHLPAEAALRHAGGGVARWSSSP